MEKKSLLIRICNALGKKFKIFRHLEKQLIEFEKTIRLYVYTKEWLSKKKFNFIKKFIKYDWQILTWGQIIKW